MAWVNPSPTELAADWIASRVEGADEATSGHLAQFLIVDFPDEEPELTWEAIQLVIQAFPEADLYALSENDAQRVCGLLAAGPVEDLLSYHGPSFIKRFEDAAREDPRMAWVLGGVWQCGMTDEIWNRVKRVADNSYWTRPNN